MTVPPELPEEHEMRGDPVGVAFAVMALLCVPVAIVLLVVLGGGR